MKAVAIARLGCHIPHTAPVERAAAIARTHRIELRPKHSIDGKEFKKVIDNYKNETAISKPKDKLVQARFNCTQCHAPQSTGDLAVSSTFQGEFSEEGGKGSSNWYEHMSDDLATLGEENKEVTAEDLANENSAAGHLDEDK